MTPTTKYLTHKIAVAQLKKASMKEVIQLFQLFECPLKKALRMVDELQDRVEDLEIENMMLRELISIPA